MKAGHEEGVAALEMALLLPLLLLFIMGILEWGFAFYTDLVLTNAVREGARFGATVEDEYEATNQARQKVEDYIRSSMYQPDAFVGALDFTELSLDTTTRELVVKATIRDYPALSPIRFFSPPLIPTNISARATMRWE